MFSNNGPSTATGVVVTEVYPNHLSDFQLESQSGVNTVSLVVSGSNVSIPVGTMASGDVYSVILSAVVTGSGGDVITNTATVYTAA